MQSFLKAHTTSIALTTILICIGLFVLYSVFNPKAPNWVTATVDTGVVTETISVSGIVTAKNTAELSFPATGKVTEVFVTEGQEVTQGEVLATLASVQLVAERNSATADLRTTQAQYNKLIAGESVQTRDVAKTNVQNAEQTLARTITQEKENVASAKKALLSSQLIALSTDVNTKAQAPIVTGSYTCTEEGQYTIDVYKSGALSGYSFRYTGLETGTQTVGIDQPSSLGTCGLYLQFTTDESYTGTTWTIAIPNKLSAIYITNVNAYSKARTQQANAVASAEDASKLTTSQAAEVTAGPQNTDVAEAQARIDGAQARISQIDAQIDDRSIVAPFDGIITDISILKGEIAPLTPSITLLASDAFELKARILERDITKIQNNQKVIASFDANPEEVLNGKVTYVSPLATNIDGVAYFEATIALDTLPTWIKSGFNADMDIIVYEETALRIPTQFLITSSDKKTAVFIQNGLEKATSTVEVGHRGTNGFTSVTDLTLGQIIITP